MSKRWLIPAALAVVGLGAFWLVRYAPSRQPSTMREALERAVSCFDQADAACLSKLMLRDEFAATDMSDNGFASLVSYARNNRLKAFSLDGPPDFTEVEQGNSLAAVVQYKSPDGRRVGLVFISHKSESRPVVFPLVCSLLMAAASADCPADTPLGAESWACMLQPLEEMRGMFEDDGIPALIWPQTMPTKVSWQELLDKAEGYASQVDSTED